MAIRTIKVLGWGVGTAYLRAKLDEEIIFSGNVALEEFSETNPFPPVLFSFDVPVEFDGTKHMEISVAKAAVRFGQIIANYTEVDTGMTVYSTGEDEYVDLAQDPDKDGIRDPRTNVKINGFEQIPDRLTYNSLGTWHWIVNPGAVLEHDLIIKPGVLD